MSTVATKHTQTLKPSRTSNESVQKQDPSPIAISYQRGKRFLLEKSAAEQGATAARQGRPGTLAERLGQEYGVDAKTIHADRRLTTAIDTIIRNFGETARALLLSSDCRLTPEQIGEISHNALPMQQYRMERLAQGKSPFTYDPGTILPCDTERYWEVKNRLDRARGLVKESTNKLDDLLQQRKLTPLESRALQMYLEYVNVCSRSLRSLVQKKSPNPPVIPEKPVGKHKGHKGDPFTQIKCFVAAAGGLTVKNVRDIPRLPSNVRPTPDEVKDITDHLRAILAFSQEMLGRV